MAQAKPFDRNATIAHLIKNKCPLLEEELNEFTDDRLSSLKDSTKVLRAARPGAVRAEREYKPSLGGIVYLKKPLAVSADMAEKLTAAGMTSQTAVGDYFSEYFGSLKDEGVGVPSFVSRDDRHEKFVAFNLSKGVEAGMSDLEEVGRWLNAKKSISTVRALHQRDNVPSSMTVGIIARTLINSESGMWDVDSIIRLVVECYDDKDDAFLESVPRWVQIGIEAED